MPKNNNAFTNPSAGKVDQQRKILEDLQRRKETLISSGSTTPVLDVDNNIQPTVAESSPSKERPSSPEVVIVSEVSGTAVDHHNIKSNTSLSEVPLPTAVLDIDTTRQENYAGLQSLAWEQAKKSSGYYILQDSSFGNTILPVIPRIPPPQPDADTSKSI